MARPAALSSKDVASRLQSRPEWNLEHDKLHRVFEFANFVEAFGFMSQIAILAEKMDHHPEWSNVYRRVEVFLTTHDAGGISELDFELAEHMDRLAPARAT
jgi:4a-hydroxytetrahydrobiopterin dehydratase